MKPFDIFAWLEKYPPPKSQANCPHTQKKEGRSRATGDMEFRIKCAEAYVRTIEPAVYRGTGSECSKLAIRVANALITGFDLSIEEARPIFQAWNQFCEPPWSPAEIDHKLKSAVNYYGHTGFPGHLFMKERNRNRAHA